MTRATFIRITLTTAVCCLLAVAAPAHEQAQARVWPYGEMLWQKDNVLASVQSVFLWGNPALEEHGMLRRFPAGYAPPPHKHPSVERVVVISGTIVVTYAGSAQKTLGPGSYSEIPAYMEHAVRCEKSAECVFLLTSSGPFAIIPSEPPPAH